MAAIDVTISGVLYDKIARTTQPVVLIGEMSYTGLSIGGGPIIPPPQGPVDPGYGVPVPPLTIWGGRPGPWDGSWVPPQPPIEKPPPDVAIPPPGSPPVVIGGTQPVAPIVPPPAIVVHYPGVGKVLVPLPTAPSS